LILSAAAWGQQKPFSHPQHLSLKLQCVTCHQAATASAKADDNLLPKPEMCVSCHTDGRAVKAPAKRVVTKFNHALHTKFGNVAPMLVAAIKGKTYLSAKHPSNLETKTACAGCHHGIETGQDAFPYMADCLVCHNKIDAPFSCEKCHATAIKPVDHTPDYMDWHNRNKEKLDRTTCAVCHGKEFHCLGCH
jgi:predicted CXXCH cytochrome family protein